MASAVVPYRNTCVSDPDLVRVHLKISIISMAYRSVWNDFGDHFVISHGTKLVT